jgi:hypothetical protein
MDNPEMGKERPHESGAAAPGGGGRMSRQRKTAAVVRLLRGEDLETVSRSLGLTAATLNNWRDAFLAAGFDDAAGERRGDGRARPAAREDRHLGGRPPFGPPETDAMSRVISPVTVRPYGITAVCRAWRMPRATVYRRRAPAPQVTRLRPGQGADVG